jgi:hypothetical protein
MAKTWYGSFPRGALRQSRNAADGQHDIECGNEDGQNGRYEVPKRTQPYDLHTHRCAASATLIHLL